MTLASAAGFGLITFAEPPPKTLVGQPRNPFPAEPPTIIDEGSALRGDQGEVLPAGR